MIYVVHVGAHYFPQPAGAEDNDFVGTFNSEKQAIEVAEREAEKLSQVWGKELVWATVAVFPQPDEAAGVKTVFSIGRP